jgi:hypothetical protein
MELDESPAPTLPNSATVQSEPFPVSNRGSPVVTVEDPPILVVVEPFSRET